MSKNTFIVADDHPLFRDALIHAIGNCVDEADIVEADSLDSLQAVVDANPDADLLLLDLNMPGVSGFSALAYIRNNHESLPTVIVSASDDPAVIRRSIQHGASGFIPKSSSIDTITQAISAILMVEIWAPAPSQSDLPGSNTSEVELAERLAQLTPQQFKVLMMMSQGLLNKQIAYELNVSEATIKAHVTAIMNKLAVSHRTQAVLAASQLSVSNPNALL